MTKNADKTIKHYFNIPLQDPPSGKKLLKEHTQKLQHIHILLYPL